MLIPAEQAQVILDSGLTDAQINSAMMTEDCGWWAVQNQIMLDGKPFGFDQHRYLIDVYSDDHPDQTYEKAAQMGLTVRALLKSVHGCLFGKYPKGVGYYFPTATDVREFSKGRLGPMLADNPHLGIKDGVGPADDVDAATQKRIGDSWLYFRGMQSRVGMKSVPLDCLVFDELDEAPDVEELVRQRLAHSEVKHILRLSTPTMPDYGVNSRFLETDQRYWLLKCEHCGCADNCMEDEFPDCLKEVKGRVIRACRKCGGELNPSKGEWVAKRPTVTDKRGYHFSQLFSHFVSPEEILKGWRTTTNMPEFMNSVVGVPWIEAEHQLTVQEVFACCGDERNAEHDDGPCSMGIDQGKGLHVVIGKKPRDGYGQVVHLGEYPDWYDLDRLMRNFKVATCVVDGQPETRDARAFAERWPGKVFLWFHNEQDRLNRPIWNDATYEVRVSRTNHLDTSHKLLTGQLVQLPRRSEPVIEFAEHCRGIARKLIDKDKEARTMRTKLTQLPQGISVYRWVRLRPDHFRQAFSYWTLAWGEMLPVRQAAAKQVQFGREREAWRP